MEKTKIGVIVVVGILVLGSLFYFATREDEETPPEENGEDVTEAGFVENEIDITGDRIYGVGDEAAFIRDGTVVHGENEIGGFDDILPPVIDINGNPGFTAIEGEEQVFMLGGEEHNRHDVYTHVKNVGEVGGELTYVELTTSETIISDMSELENPDELVDFYGEQIEEVLVHGGDTVIDEYHNIESITEIDGDIAFRALNEDSDMVVVQGDNILSEHEFVTEGPQEIGGQLAYLASDSNDAYLVLDGDEQEEYRDVNMLTDIDGEPAYTARESRYDFVVVGGEERERFGIPYEGINGLFEIGREAFYIVENRYGEEFAVYEGEQGERYDDIDYVTEVNGVPYYRAYRDGTWYIVRGLGEVVDSTDEDDGNLGGPVDVGGELAYKVSENGEEYIVHGDEETDSYDWVGDPGDFGGDLGFMAEEAGDSLYVFDGIESQRFDDISSVINLNELPKLLGVRNGQEYLVELEGVER